MKKENRRRRRKSQSKSNVEQENRLITDYFVRTKRIPTKQLEVAKEKLIRQHIESDTDPKDSLDVRDFADKGKGIVATQMIAKGSFICEYSGDLIDIDEAKLREKNYQRQDVGCYMYYFMHGRKRWCVDATKPSGRYGRLINHSRKSPNCKTRVFIFEEKPRLIFIALRDIIKDEEVLYDYGEKDRNAIEANPWLANS